jgi:hypothetical protein
LVALVDLGVYGSDLSVGCRMVGNVLQWYDGQRLRLVRGRLLEERTRRRSFEFERASDRQVLRFAELTRDAFEKRFRSRFPSAPREGPASRLREWLRRNHGLWR